MVGTGPYHLWLSQIIKKSTEVSNLIISNYNQKKFMKERKRKFKPGPSPCVLDKQTNKPGSSLIFFVLAKCGVLGF